MRRLVRSGFELIDYLMGRAWLRGIRRCYFGFLAEFARRRVAAASANGVRVVPFGGFCKPRSSTMTPKGARSSMRSIWVPSPEE